MKKTLFILIISIISLPGLTQNTHLNKKINLSNIKGCVEEILKEISKKGNFYFTYSNNIPVKQEIELKINNKTVEEFLQELFIGFPIEYIERGNKIILYIKKDANDELKLKQNVKGKIFDQDTKTPLIGALIYIKDNPKLGCITNANGFFNIVDVPVGRHCFNVSFLGYQTKTVNNIIVGSAKEIYLDIELEEHMQSVAEAVVIADMDKTRPRNSMALVSARSFSVEETRRFAGGVDDPGRMASSFAGVSSTGRVEDNGIVIRGNAPKGVLWRLEGVEIPYPSHFPGGDYTGGGAVTLFSSNLLSNSDFFTGAFPAEYGNAYSGVFDVKLRNGNNSQREYTFQAGVLGLDFAAEGPFIKEGNASYLFNYRYSTMGLVLPLLVVDQRTDYQDLSFKLNFPTSKAGTFSVWGIGGIDHTLNPEENDSLKWEVYEDQRRYEAGVKLGAMGFNHKYSITNKSFLFSTIATTYTGGHEFESALDDSLILKRLVHTDQSNGRCIFSSSLTHKFNQRLTNKTGLTFNYLFYNIDIKRTSGFNDPMNQYAKESGNSNFYQVYTQFKYNLMRGISINGGIYAQMFSLNNHYTIEPRLSIKWTINSKSSLGIGYGKHSQLEELKVYFAQRETNSGYKQLNKDLDFAKADHYILEYNLKLNENLVFKVEPYYQYLYDIPVIEDSYYSFINYGSEPFFNDSVVNKGTGSNIGIDFTLEKYLSNNSYFLLTSSLFNSKYKGGDQKEYNSRYNRNYVISGLFGKEYTVGKNKNNLLGFNGRICIRGGERYIPVNNILTSVEHRLIFDSSRAYEEQWPSTTSFDLTITFRINKKKHSSVWALQVLNLLGSKTYYGFDYNYNSNSAVRDELQITIPSVSYKIEF